MIDKRDTASESRPVVSAIGRRLPVEVDPAAHPALESHPVRQAGADRDEIGRRDQALLAVLDVHESQAAFEHVQDCPMARGEGVLGLESGWEGVLGEGGG